MTAADQIGLCILIIVNALAILGAICISLRHQNKVMDSCRRSITLNEGVYYADAPESIK